jgi:hypothetical protein
MLTFRSTPQPPTNMNRGLDAIESAAGSLFPFSNAELKDTRTLINNHCGKCCLSICCGPCLVGYELEKLGRTRKVAVCNCLLLTSANVLKDSAVHYCSATTSAVEGTAGTFVLNLPTIPHVAIGCGLMALAAIPYFLVAKTFDEVNGEWGGSGYTGKYCAYLWTCEACFIFQFARAVDASVEADQSLVSTAPMLSSQMQ